jgi:hypothetical protein
LESAIDKTAQKLTQHDGEVQNIFLVLKNLMQKPKEAERKTIGFSYPNKK